MPLNPCYGHEAVRQRFAGALRNGRLPQAMLLEGPVGVGKQRLALWLGQLMVCEQAGAEPCGNCRSCRLVLGLAHPDVIWLVPLELTKRGADAEKQVELVETALAEEMERRRDEALTEPPGGLAAHGIASIRYLARRLALKPALAARRLVIIGDAERLIPQRSNPEAANALLKTLEEPPPATTIVLTAAEPEALLPTILSRVVRIRVGRLPDSVVASFVQHEYAEAVPASQLEARVAQADGCIGRLAGVAEGDGASAGAEAFLLAARQGPAARYAAALAQRPYEARGGFTALLDALLARLRGAAREGRDSTRLVAAIARVLEARSAAQGNVNPQLLAAVLADDLGGAA